MSGNFVQNASARKVGLFAARSIARAQIWRRGPRIFVNSVPKAGTHLLTAELSRFPSTMESRLHIEKGRVNRKAVGGARSTAFELDAHAFEALVQTVRGGQFFTAHLPFDDAIHRILHREEVRSTFMARDPRDILVSQFHYIMGLKRHDLHEYLAGLGRDDLRWNALAFGVEGPLAITGVQDRLAAFQGWLTAPGVLVVRFEDLVGARGGGDEATKAETLRAIASHCGLSDAGIEERSATASNPTATLRKGKANAWRGEIPDSVVERLHAESGDLIRAYGYSVD